MGWKEWPYWLKGGVILLTLYVLASLLYVMFFSSWQCSVETEQGTAHPYCPFFTQLKLFFRFDGIPFLYGGMALFLIGVVVGWIVGKFKSRNQ